MVDTVACACYRENDQEEKTYETCFTQLETVSMVTSITLTPAGGTTQQSINQHGPDHNFLTQITEETRRGALDLMFTSEESLTGDRKG